MATRSTPTKQASKQGKEKKRTEKQSKQRMCVCVCERRLGCTDYLPCLYAKSVGVSFFPLPFCFFFVDARSFPASSSLVFALCLCLSVSVCIHPSLPPPSPSPVEGLTQEPGKPPPPHRGTQLIMYRAASSGQDNAEQSLMLDTCDDVRLFLADGFSTFASFVNFVLPKEVRVRLCACVM